MPMIWHSRPMATCLRWIMAPMPTILMSSIGFARGCTMVSHGAFILSWGAAGGTLSYKGQDLLYLQLTKKGDNYEAITTEIARGFKNPIDAVLIENRLYVLEYGGNGAIWELTFE